jgi:hypothetical protein
MLRSLDRFISFRSPRTLFLEELERRIAPSLAGSQLFPADNPWNQQITNAPVAANSATLVASIGKFSPFHPDFGTTYAGALDGIPINIVTGSQPKIPVTIDAYADESDLLPIPIPNNVVIEGDPLPSAQNTGDRHMLVYDETNNILYETFNTHRPSETGSGWHADSEAVWNLNADSFRTPGWTSADAAGLPILPGLVRPDEVLDQGKITHALRFTVPATDNAYVFPASHVAGSHDPSLPRMGERFRLKASFDISGFSPTNQLILQALKDYGMIVADNGSAWYLSGEPSTRWSDDDLHQLTQLVGSDFEAVDLTPIVTALLVSSSTAQGGTQIVIAGQNFSGGAGLTQVWFGSTLATTVTIVSDTQMVVTTPAHVAGTVDVTVHAGYGASATSSADRFTFLTPGPGGVLQFAPAAYSVSETGGTVTLTVTRTTGTTGMVTVLYATRDGSARAGADYTASSGMLTFGNGVGSQTIVIPILDDHVIGEGSETFQVLLANPTGGAVLGSTPSAGITIQEDNDTGVASTLIAIGADAGGGPEVRVVHGLGETLVRDFYAYDPRFVGGVRVAIGDVLAPGVPDIVTAPGPGGGPDVRVFDAATGRLVREFMAYSPYFSGGVFVAVADVNGDGYGDIITGADYGGGPHVEVWSGKDQTLLYSFMAYDPRFLGGVRVAGGDVNGDGKADIIAAPGVTGGPDVRVYSGANGHLIREIMAYDPRFAGGVYVSAGDFNSDGKADIVTAAGAGGGPHIEVFSGADGSLLRNFMAFAPTYAGGVRVAVIADVNNDGAPEIIASTGPSAAPEVRLYDGATLARLDDFYAFDPRFLGGVFVGGQ